MKGSTPLHGNLHKDPNKWRAEIHGISQDFGDSSVWVEQVRAETTPVYDLASLAERDALTALVLESLEGGRRGDIHLPEEIDILLKSLPREVSKELEDELKGDRSQVLSDVRAIILEAIQASGATNEN